MGKQELTGMVKEDIPKVRAKFEDSPAAKWYEFEERYCLHPIPYQPEDYDGPERFCKQTAQGEANYHLCEIHAGFGNRDTLDNCANLKHGMYATDENLIEHLEPDEKELYNEVLSWAETYYINPKEDPSVWDDLQMLAVERVRVYRTSKWMLDKGETREKPIFDAEGNFVENEDAPNALSDEHRKLKKLVMGLKKDLGLTRKESLKQDDRSRMAEGAEALSETMAVMVQDTDKEYDADDYEYEGDE